MNAKHEQSHAKHEPESSRSSRSRSTEAAEAFLKERNKHVDFALQQFVEMTKKTKKALTSAGLNADDTAVVIATVAVSAFSMSHENRDVYGAFEDIAAAAAEASVPAEKKS